MQGLFCNKEVFMSDIQFLNKIERALEKDIEDSVSHEQFNRLFDLYKSAVRNALNKRKEYIENFNELKEIAEETHLYDDVDLSVFEFKRQTNRNNIPTYSGSDAILCKGSCFNNPSFL